MSSGAPTNDQAIQKFRSSFHSSDRFIQINNAGVSPISIPVRDTVIKWTNRFCEEGIHGIIASFPGLEATRVGLASLLGATPDEVAFFPSTASAISQVALGLGLKPGDEILVWDQEYPSNLYPWHVAAERTGARLVLAESGPNLETPTERLLAKVTERTRVIAFSWVQYRTGAITEIQEVTQFARARGIFTCSDIIQGAGFLPFDFQASGLDAACGGSHKWFSSTVSTGYLLLRKENINRLAPIMVGAMTYGGPDKFYSPDTPMQANANRFEPGSKSFLDLLALGTSVQLMRDVSIARISQEVEWISRSLMHGLRELGYAIHSPHGKHHRGSIVNFSPSADAPVQSLEEIENRLNSIGASFAKRPPGIRLGPHAFNTITQIEKVLSALS